MVVEGNCETHSGHPEVFFKLGEHPLKCFKWNFWENLMEEFIFSKAAGILSTVLLRNSTTVAIQVLFLKTDLKDQD